VWEPNRPESPVWGGDEIEEEEVEPVRKPLPVKKPLPTLQQKPKIAPIATNKAPIANKAAVMVPVVKPQEEIKPPKTPIQASIDNNEPFMSTAVAGEQVMKLQTHMILILNLILNLIERSRSSKTWSKGIWLRLVSFRRIRVMRKIEPPLQKENYSRLKQSVTQSLNHSQTRITDSRVREERPRDCIMK